ncbi:MATE family efflux transporter [Niabella ginsengisoli]|uniref:Multidrug-efflux transporter n=1 Tax=Niabella ginsengisoli TaxID=522298 RepID=A0ABS9SII1_9BACT|nr:MATE family efflux transporter [Niabella ginsengisoli]MCH5598145.1 MATE family efflux transporter [Niabella ginsengisoli]
MIATNQLENLQVGISNRQILKIAAPIALAMMIPQLNFIANTVFLSHLGESELGTAGIAGVYYLVFALVGNGLNSGLQALIARRAGENRPKEIGRLFLQSIYIALLFSFFIIGINYLLVEVFLSSVLKSSVVLNEAVSFLKIRAWGLPFLYIFQMGNALLVGSNNSKYLKFGFIAEALVNIFFDYTLIFGKLGFPALGFNGAAYASILAEITGAIIVFSIIFRKGFVSRFSLFTHKSIDAQTIKVIFHQSLPLVLQFVLSVSSWLLFYVLIEHHGERKLAISNTMRNIFAVFGIFTWSYANTTNMMVSNIIGQNRQDDVLYLIKKIVRLSVFTIAILCLTLNLFPRIFLSIYGVDESFIADAIPVVRTISVCLVMMSIAVVWLNSITGTGNTKVNLRIEIVSIIVYTIYIYIVLEVLQLSLVMAWASEFIYWFVTFILAWLYMRSNKWKGKVIWK